MKKSARKTPIRRALLDESELLARVADGLGALKRADRECFEREIRNAFADSLDLNEAMRPGRDRDHRWDCLLGHHASETVIAVEPHSAAQGEVSVIISKCTRAKEQLRDHLRDGVKIAKWLWVASGKVTFSGIEKAARQLDQHGVEFVGTRVAAKHLPAASASGNARVAKKPGRSQKK